MGLFPESFYNNTLPKQVANYVHIVVKLNMT